MSKKKVVLALYILLTTAVWTQTVKMDAKPLVLNIGEKTVIEWTVVKEGIGILQVVNASGKPVRTLDAGGMKPGNYHVEFDSKDFLGRNLPAGEYIIRISVNPRTEPDMSFGVNGMLGTVSKKFIFKNERTFNLGVKEIIPASVTVKVDGEDWKTGTDFSTVENTFKVDENGIIELNPKAELQDNADIEISASVGLPLVNPWDVKVAPDNTLYIVDNIYLIDREINKLTTTQSRPGFVYKVDAEGKPVQDFGICGALKSTNTLCNGLAVDNEGNLYLSTQHNYVAVCDSRGNEKMKVAGFTFPKLEGGYDITGIAVNENKRLVIVNRNQTNVIYDATKPDLEGFLACQDYKSGVLLPPVPGHYCGPCVAATGDFYYETTYNNNLIKYKYDEKNKEFSIIWRTPESYPFSTRPKGGREQLWHAIGIALDGTGLIYVADRMNHRIQVFFDAGQTYKHVCSFGSEGSDVQKCQMMAPHAVAVSPDGKVLYVADDGYFYKLNYGLRRTIPVVKGLSRVTKLKVVAEETVERKLTIK